MLLISIFPLIMGLFAPIIRKALMVRRSNYMSKSLHENLEVTTMLEDIRVRFLLAYVGAAAILALAVTIY